jgi:ParB family transcriptional regulator, chromosome partitioning protein
MATKKLKLGRGLDELLGLGGKPDLPENGDGELRRLPIEKLKPGRFQPRSAMDPERLAELADSIRAQGLIQPIVVRKTRDGGYEIIAGERRWRAAQQAGLSDVPCVLREVDDRATVAMALIENIQREDLSPLEEAGALQRLIDEFDLTHQQAAEAVGRSRAAVSNLLRLLELPEEIRRLLESGGLEMGHARALLTLPEARAIALAREASAKGWSVRELEQRARAAQKARPPARKKPGVDPDVRRLEQDLGEKLGARVAIQQGRGGRGKLVVHYHSLDELDGILARIV